MMNVVVDITRIWLPTVHYIETDADGNSDYVISDDEDGLLYKRPRINYKISEYVFDYINKKILEPANLMQTGYYIIYLCFYTYNKEDQFHNHHIQNIYDTENTIYYLTKPPSCGKRGINISCYSTELHENISPKEYANIVYDMIGAYLTNKYKNKYRKISKEIMDKNKNGMDYNYIESFNYPAVYEDQKYSSDSKEYKEKYLKYYNEKSKEEKEKYRKYFNE
jgi:hypothetical protein